MAEMVQKQVIDFAVYPPVGGEDWRYAFATAKVRALETVLLSKPVLHDMINAANFDQTVDVLSSTEYALGQGSRTIGDIEKMLLEKRTAVRKMFCDLMEDSGIVTLLKSRVDFSNLRLAVRREVTDKPIGLDYSDDGNVPADEFEQVFESESYFKLPEHMQEAIEQAVLAYYQDKDIRRIDYAIDNVQALYAVREAEKLNNEFMAGLSKMQTDLTNIRTMLRLKFAEMDIRDVFLEGGYIEIERFKAGIEAGFDTIPQIFFATPYHHIVDSGTHYLAGEKSFLRLEQLCDEFIDGYLKSTNTIAAGPQPVIAYLLIKEKEIRDVRLVLTAKKNQLDNRVVLDRIGK
ncbi:MAG: V-type ATPase subunit [Phycisphaerae bacterium]|nr:V-type ATPase subunit [Phycisphaerae bacterium]